MRTRIAAAVGVVAVAATTAGCSPPSHPPLAETQSASVMPESVQAQWEAEREAEREEIAAARAARDERAQPEEREAPRAERAVEEGAADQERDPAAMLMVIDRPGWRERDRVETRFRYLLPRIAGACPDVANEMHAADMIVAVTRQIQEVGMEAGHLQTAEAHNQMTSQLHDVSKCVDLFAAYSIMRRDGSSSEDAIKGVVGLYRALLGG